MVKPIIRRYLNPEKRLELEEIKEYVDSLSKLFTSVRTFGDLAETINHINRNENQQEIEKSIDEIRKTRDNLEEKRRELLEIDAFVDVMFEILKQTYSELLFTYQTMKQNFENFEDKLHHTILLSLFEKNLLVTKTEYPYCSQQIDSIIEKSFRYTNENFHYLLNYRKFVELLEGFLEKQNTSSIVKELLVQCKSKSFLKEFHDIFKRLLPCSYELLEITEINNRLKHDIYDMICHGKDNFNDIQNCIRNLVDRVQLHASIKIDFNLRNVKESLEKIFNSLNQCIMNTTTDEGAIHYIRAYLQTTMMIQVDYYMNSVATFRHES
ncbi:unnamed protein product [Rotaria magnacalcarata]|uniref:Uncharacterized protein n=1 Tax=Rotaria magnacalcarata TaxID=392030 RepID=A0A816MST5_9BILA|nr:unnamed protein product [Rotaria magnacalcarata]